MAHFSRFERSVERRHERPGRVRALAAALGTTLAGLAAGLLAQLAVFIPLGALGVGLSPLAQVLLMLLLVQGVGFIGVAAWILRSPRTPLGWPRVARPSRRDRRWMVRGYLLALGGAIAGGLLLTALGIEPAPNELAGIGLEDPRVFLVLVPLAFLVIGPAEELLFRGVVQRRLRQAFGPAAAVTLASVIFAIVHLFALATGDLAGMLGAVAVLLLPSLALGASYERTDNLLVPVVVHGAYNATLFLGLYAAMSAS